MSENEKKYKLIEPDKIENYSENSDDIVLFSIFKENYAQKILKKFGYIIESVEFSKEVQHTSFEPELEDEFLPDEIEAYVAQNQHEWWTKKINNIVELNQWIREFEFQQIFAYEFLITLKSKMSNYNTDFCLNILSGLIETNDYTSNTWIDYQLPLLLFDTLDNMANEFPPLDKCFDILKNMEDYEIEQYNISDNMEDVEKAEKAFWAFYSDNLDQFFVDYLECNEYKRLLNNIVEYEDQIIDFYQNQKTS